MFWVFFFLLVFESASKIHENKQQQPPPQKKVCLSLSTVSAQAADMAVWVF